MAHQGRFARLWDMSFGGNDTTNEIPHGFVRFLTALATAMVKICFRFSVKEQQNIALFKGKERGAVVVSPHVSYLDVIVMFLSVRPTHQWLRLIGKDSLFHGFMGWLLSNVGAFPVKRDSADRTAVKRASKMLKNGELIGVFPEGTRRGKGDKPPTLHAGAALIARMGRAPLVPLGLQNVALVKQKGKRLRFPRVTAVFGQPVALSAFDFLPKEDRLDGCMWYVMRESLALSAGTEPEEVDMSALFPDSKDYTQSFDGVVIERVKPEDLKDYEGSVNLHSSAPQPQDE